MDLKTIEQLAKHPDLQWTLTQAEVAKRLGRCRQYTASFLEEHSVPFYRVGKEKTYLIWDVLEAIEKTRWKDPRKGDSHAAEA